MKLHIKIVLTAIVTLSLLIYLAGFFPIFSQAPTNWVITGRIMAPSPETTENIAVANAILTLTDSEGDIHIVTTDEDGYYYFSNLAVDANSVITAIAIVNGINMVFKDVIPEAVAAPETYDAGTADIGTADAESTALALIVDELIEQGLTYEDIDLEIIQKSGEAPDLSSLSVSEGILYPDFSSDTTSYEVAVTNCVDSITFTPTAVEPAIATIEVDGTTVASGIPSVPVSLGVGDNSVFIVVTTEDETTKTYTVTVNRNILKDNADLSNISLSVGALEPDFSSDTTSYKVEVANSVSSITFTPTADDAAATITVNGKPSAPVSLDVGDNIISIMITAEDGISTKTYTVTVNRVTTFTLTMAIADESTGSGTIVPSEDGIYTYNYGDKVNIKAKANTDSDFTGWITNENIDNTAKANTRVTMNTDQTVIATFALKTYILTMKTVGAGAGTVIVDLDNDKEKYDHGEEVTINALADTTNSEFVRWLHNKNIDNTDNANTKVTMNGNQIVIAMFTKKRTCTLTMTIDETGTGSGKTVPSEGGTYTYAYGKRVNIKAKVSKGSEFTGWVTNENNIDNTTEANTRVTMIGDQAVTAIFTKKEACTLKMAVTGTGSGTISPAKGAHTYDHGKRVNIKAKASKDSEFTGWLTNANIADTTKANTKVTMNDGQTVTAIFTLKDVTLTMAIAKKSTGSGTVSPDEGDHTYDHGDTVTISATADLLSSDFIGWVGDDSDDLIENEDGTYSITMNSNKSVTATFTLKEVTLTMSVDGTGSGATNPVVGTYTLAYDYGDTINISTTADASSEFTGWLTNENIADTTKANTKVTMNDDLTVTAIFTLKTNTITASAGENGSIVPPGLYP